MCGASLNFRCSSLAFGMVLGDVYHSSFAPLYLRESVQNVCRMKFFGGQTIFEWASKTAHTALTMTVKQDINALGIYKHRHCA